MCTSFSSTVFPAISLVFTILLLLRSQLYLWGSPSSSAFPAVSVVHLFLLRSQLSLGFTFFVCFCIPSYISEVQLLLLRSQLYLVGAPSSSSVFPSISLKVDKSMRGMGGGLGGAARESLNQLHIKGRKCLKFSSSCDVQRIIVLAGYSSR